MNNSSTDLETCSSPPPARHHQQRAYSVTAMPSELQKSVLRHQEAEQQEKLRHNQPWWQYYYQLYHYQLPPGRKPTVFGPYLLLQTMGEGEFGKVKFGIEVKTGQEVAIKLIRKDSIDSSSRMTKVEREISVLRILHHPNIVQLFDVIETEKYIGIILQCATGGELFDYILAHRYLKERDASRLFAQLISGVHYMHQKHIVHRDLKLENLLLDRHRNVLITDFGFANQFSATGDDLMSTSCGSPCYAAPELVMNQGVYVGPAVDIWSCGVILFAMLCGYLPYDDDPANPESYNINLLYKYILNTPLVFPEYISDEACDLLSLMLVPDPEKRCAMETIMAHPWLTPHQHLFVTVEKEEMDQVVPEIIKPEQPQEIPVESIDHDEPAVVPEIETKEQDTPMGDITSIELPPPTLIEDETVNDTPMTEPVLIEKEEKEEEIPPPPPIAKDKPIPVLPEEENVKDEALSSVSPLPSPSTTLKQDRPKSTSTEKVLHFLSGNKDTTKRNTTPIDKRTRHMSLTAATPSVNNETSTGSILQAKFLSSMQHRKQSTTPELSSTPSPAPNSSASTPHPSKANNSRRTPMTPPPPQPVRGTRRKTLSLLVNSMTDNKIPFSNKRASKLPQAAQMTPSVSEHTVNTLTDKEKHRSAGKKLMDWFKKKPLSTIHKSTTPSNSDTALHQPVATQQTNSIDPKLRTHHGAVDGEALTSRPPAQVFSEVKQTLKALGLEFKRDGGEYKLKCVRPKKPITNKVVGHQNQIQQQHGNTNTPFRLLLRRPSSTTPTPPPVEESSTIYGDPNVDPGEEIRFSVELCKIKNLPGLYIVDMRRMRGNVWAYKFIYRTLLDTLNLGGKSGYLKTTTALQSTVTTGEEEISSHRMSTASSGANSHVILEEQIPPPTPIAKEIAV